MLNLDADASLLDRYKVLERQDLKIDTAVIAPDVRGQRNKSLPWFWSMDVRRDADVGAWMTDCKRILVMHALMDAQKKLFICSLSGALAESESPKGTVDRRASMSPS
jgi:hypothetical protein